MKKQILSALSCFMLLNAITFKLFSQCNVDLLVSSAGCSAFANATGGIAPYHYRWNTGQTTSSITVSSNGTYSVVSWDSSPTIPPCSSAVKTITVTGCGQSTWYLDADNDGYYSATQQATSSPGAGWSTSPGQGSGDCNDNNAAINPGVTPTSNDLIVTSQDPAGKQCDAHAMINYANKNCWTSYDVEVRDNSGDLISSTNNVIQQQYDQAIDGHNSELSGTYSVKITDNRGIVLQKQITITTPACNSTLSYIIDPPNANECINEIKISIQGTDCFDHWYANIGVSNPPPNTFLEDGGIGHTANKGGNISYTTSFPFSAFPPDFTIQNAVIVFEDGQQCNVNNTTVNGLIPNIGCDAIINSTINSLPSTHCSSDGSITYTYSSHNPCFDNLDINLIYARANPTIGTNNIVGSSPVVFNSATGTYTASITFNGLQAGFYTANCGYGGSGNGLFCSAFDSRALVAASNIPLLSFTTTKTNITCGNDHNGTVTAHPTGGVSPYQYQWTLLQPLPYPDIILSETTKKIRQLEYGKYSLELTDAVGCKVNDKQTEGTEITSQYPPINITQSQTDVTTYNGRDGTATATVAGGVSPYTISWNTNPPVVNTNVLTSTVSRLKAKIYKATVTDMVGCVKKATYTIAQPPQRMGETVSDFFSEESELLQVYPGLASDNITIDFACNSTENKIEIINLLGKQVFSKTIYENENGPCHEKIDITNLSPGLYLVHITNETGQQAKKFIKE